MERRLRRLKERFTSKSDIHLRMEKLEASFQCFQAETNMKLALVYEILSLNCERMNRGKSELQRQHDCETLLESWKNVEDLAANQLSFRILYDVNNDMELVEIPDGYGTGAKSSTNTHVSSSNKRLRRGRGSNSSVSSLSADEAESDGEWEPNDSSLDNSRSKPSKSTKQSERKRKMPTSNQSSIRAKDDDGVDGTKVQLLKSEILNYFEITKHEGWARPRGICKLCNKAVSAEIQRLRNHVGKCSARPRTRNNQVEKIGQDEKHVPHGIPEFHNSTVAVSGDFIKYEVGSETTLLKTESCPIQSPDAPG